MQKKFVSYKKKIAFVKETAKEVLSLRKDISTFDKAYSKLEASFNNPKSVFDPKKVQACAKTLSNQMEYLQNKLASQESKFREALNYGVPTTAIEETTHKLASLISKVALLKAVAETSLGEEMLEINDDGYLIESKKDEKCGGKGCGEKKALEDTLEIDDDGYLVESKKKTAEEAEEAPKAEEETKEEEAPKAEEKEEAPAEEAKEEEAPKAEDGEAKEEEASETEEDEDEEEKPVTQEELESINEDVMAEIFGLSERIENVEEQLGIENTVNASVKASKSDRVQKMKLASASKKQAVSSQDVLDTIINMEIH